MRPNNIGRYRWNSRFIDLFLERGAIHGLPYVAKRQLTLLERILWLILTFVALFISIHLALQSLDRFKTKSTVISIERDHYFWNTTLPSVTVCPMTRLNPRKVQKYCRDQKITLADCMELYAFLETLANSTYFNFNTIKEYPSVDEQNINPKDYMYLIFNLTENKVTLSATKDRVINQRDGGVIRTQQVLTEWGICYTTNNYLLQGMSTSNLLFGKPADPIIFEDIDEVHTVLSVNIFDPKTQYNFVGFQGSFETFVHGAYEVMQIQKRRGSTQMALGCTVQMYEITVSEDLEKATTVEQRKCRFPHESNLEHFPIYTRNLCQQECRINLAYELCKCIPHFFPNRGAIKPVCHYKVLKNCLSKYAGVFENLSATKNLSLNDTFQCNCLPNCRSSEVVESKCEKLPQSDGFLETNGVIVSMENFPNVRYRREIIFTLTDLLVSIGGTAGFFLGSSVLSAVEIIYYFTVRLFWHCFGYRE